MKRWGTASSPELWWWLNDCRDGVKGKKPESRELRVFSSAIHYVHTGTNAQQTQKHACLTSIRQQCAERRPVCHHGSTFEMPLVRFVCTKNFWRRHIRDIFAPHNAHTQPNWTGKSHGALSIEDWKMSSQYMCTCVHFCALRVCAHEKTPLDRRHTIILTSISI